MATVCAFSDSHPPGRSNVQPPHPASVQCAWRRSRRQEDLHKTHGGRSRLLARAGRAQRELLGMQQRAVAHGPRASWHRGARCMGSWARSLHFVVRLLSKALESRAECCAALSSQISNTMSFAAARTRCANCIALLLTTHGGMPPQRLHICRLLASTALELLATMLSFRPPKCPGLTERTTCASCLHMDCLHQGRCCVALCCSAAANRCDKLDACWLWLV